MVKGSRSLWFAAPGLLFIAWLVGLWILSSLPGKELDFPPFPGADKVAHFALFRHWWTSFRVLVEDFAWNAWQVNGTGLFVIALIGALDELHQLHTQVARAATLPTGWLTPPVALLVHL